MNGPLLLYFLLIHFLADFGLQTHEQATNKSSDITPKYLIYHVGVYSIIWLLASFMLFSDPWVCVLFAGITFVCHFITDFFTSRINKSFFDKGDYHNGFVGVGFDQVLHYIQLYLTYILLK